MNQLVKTVTQTLSKHSPTIFTGLGCLGVIGTAIVTVKCTDAARANIEYAEEIEGCTFSPKTKLKYAWKHYIPAVMTGAASIGCIIGAHKIQLARTGSAILLYEGVTEATKLYKEKVVEQIGTKKEQLIRDEVAKESIKRDMPRAETIYISGKGDALCYDRFAGRYFRSSIEELRQVQNHFNHELLQDHWMSLNQLYLMLNMEETDLGEEMGWTPDVLLDFEFSSQLTDDGEPCLVISYMPVPKMNYYE